MNIYKKKKKRNNSKLISSKHDSEPVSGAWRPPDPPPHQLDFRWTFCMEVPVYCPPPQLPHSPPDTTSKCSPGWCQPFLLDNWRYSLNRAPPPAGQNAPSNRPWEWGL